MLQYYCNFTIRLFRVLSWTPIGGVLLLCRDAVGVFFCRLGYCGLHCLNVFHFPDYHFLQSFCRIATYIYKAETIKHNLRTSMNERTHLFKNISLKLYSRNGWCFWGAWKMSGNRNRLLYWPNFFSWPLSSRTHSAIIPHLVWLLNRGSMRATALSLQAGPHSGPPVTN